MGATDDLTLRMRAAGARTTARDVDRTTSSVHRFRNEARKTEKDSVRAGASLRVFSGGFGTLRLYATSAAAALGIAGLGGSVQFAVNAASDLNEEVNKANVVFRGGEKAVQEWSKTASDAFGQSRQQALAAASTFGNMLVPMGFWRKDAAKMSMTLVSLASDLASFNNASPEDVLEAIRAGLAGEAEPLRKFGVFLNDARLKQEALSLGLYKGKGNLDNAAKAAATYALILKDTKDAQGDFARTSNGLANQERILKAQVTDLAAELGTYLLPTVNRIVGGLVDFVKGLREGTGAGGKFEDTAKAAYEILKKTYPILVTMVSAYVGFRLAVLGAAAAEAIFAAATTAIAWAQLILMVRSFADAWVLLDMAMAANPIGLVVAALFALGVGLYFAYKRVGWFHNAVNAVWDFIKHNWPELLGVLTGPFGMAAILVLRHWDKVKKFFESIPDTIKGGLSGVLNWFIRQFNHVIDLINAAINAYNKIPFAPNVGTIGHIGTVDSGPGPDDRGGAAGGGPRPPLAPASGPQSAHPGGESVFDGDIVVPITLTADGKPFAKAVHRQGVKKKSTR